MAKIKYPGGFVEVDAIPKKQKCTNCSSANTTLALNMFAYCDSWENPHIDFVYSPEEGSFFWYCEEVVAQVREYK